MVAEAEEEVVEAVGMDTGWGTQAKVARDRTRTYPARCLRPSTRVFSGTVTPILNLTRILILNTNHTLRT